MPISTPPNTPPNIAPFHSRSPTPPLLLSFLPFKQYPPRTCELIYLSNTKPKQALYRDTLAPKRREYLLSKNSIICNVAPSFVKRPKRDVFTISPLYPPPPEHKFRKEPPNEGPYIPENHGKSHTLHSRHLFCSWAYWTEAVEVAS